MEIRRKQPPYCFGRWWEIWTCAPAPARKVRHLASFLIRPFWEFRSHMHTPPQVHANTTDKDIKVDIIFESNKVYWKPYISQTTLKAKETGKLQMTLATNECPLYGPIETKVFFVVNGTAHKSSKEAFTFKADVKQDFSKMNLNELRAYAEEMKRKQAGR